MWAVGETLHTSAPGGLSGSAVAPGGRVCLPQLVTVLQTLVLPRKSSPESNASTFVM